MILVCIYVVVCFLLVYFLSLLSLSLECLISCSLNDCRGKHVQTWSLKNIAAGGMLVAGGRVRYSYLSIFSDDNADIFATSLLILCCSFSSLILSSIIRISFYIISKRFFLERKGLFDARVLLIQGWKN